MKLTNKQGLPEAIVNAVKNDSYSAGNSDISATRLISPPQQVYLQKEWYDKIEEDVSGRIWSLLGQSVHHILERAANYSDIVEERYFTEINGWNVSGQVDLISKDALYDFKVTSSWSVLNGHKIEWEQQLNVLHYLADDPDVEELKIIAILRDWSKSNAMRSHDYPRSQVIELDIPLWTKEEQEEYVKERVVLHQRAQLEHEYPKCSPEERWQKDDVWALMKEGRKSAVKLHSSEGSVEEHLENMDNKHYIEFRPGESIRCKDYCSVNKFCNQYKELINE